MPFLLALGTEVPYENLDWFLPFDSVRKLDSVLNEWHILNGENQRGGKKRLNISLR